jgi:hypothetical protein
MSSAELLVVASKVRSYMKAAGMSTASAALPVISDKVRAMCDAAVAKAKADRRKTVLDRDFE